ncbi:MAG: type II secretion system F family protein [Planctomycetota bacterium]|nr:type II secretion system F family protein [Planctomycetota bacterium]
MEIAIIASILVGISVGLLPLTGRDYFRQGVEFIESDLRDKLRRLRVNTHSLHGWILTWLVAVAGVFLGFLIGAGSVVFAILFSVLLICVPWYVVRRLAERRRQKIEDQLADAMVTLSSSIKAGLSLGQALEILAQQCPNPICQEFRQMVGEYQMGQPLDRVLEDTRIRLRSENFALFAAAMQASRESGGRLNETVERIAQSVLELQRLERKILSETAQARTSGMYMALAPLAVLAMYYFVLDPENTSRLFTTVPGQIILSLSLVFDIVAYVWSQYILASDI